MTPRPTGPKAREEEPPAEQIIELGPIPEAQFVIGQTLLQSTLNVLVELPYKTPVPGVDGLIAGDLINAIRALTPIGADNPE